MADPDPGHRSAPAARPEQGAPVAGPVGETAPRRPVCATLRRPHLWLPGATRPPLLLLHGTGGSEHDLVPLAGRIAPGAPRLGPRGTVLEDGTLRRFFRRIRDGVLDEDDLRDRADEMAEFLTAAGAAYRVRPGSWVAVGFSNGANMASALLARHPGLVAGAVLACGVPPFRAGLGDIDLTRRRVAVVHGLRDALVTPEQSLALAGQLRGRGADVVELAHPGGHEIDDAVVPGLRRFVAGLAA